jgi:hypothetical protein
VAGLALAAARRPDPRAVVAVRRAAARVNPIPCRHRWATSAPMPSVTRVAEAAAVEVAAAAATAAAAGASAVVVGAAEAEAGADLAAVVDAAAEAELTRGTHVQALESKALPSA